MCRSKMHTLVNVPDEIDFSLNKESCSIHAFEVYDSKNNQQENPFEQEIKKYSAIIHKKKRLEGLTIFVCPKKEPSEFGEEAGTFI